MSVPSFETDDEKVTGQFKADASGQQTLST